MSWMRPLGTTGLEVSALGLGTVKLGRNEALRYPGEFELPDDATAGALLAQARDLGINLLDTAPAYGLSEERLGRMLRGQRDHWVICSKAGEEFGAGRSRFDFSPAHIGRSVRRSLRRLNTDVIDILLLHSNGDDLAIIKQSGALETLADLRREGLIRAFGMSTKTVEGGIAAARRCDAVMLTYNLNEQQEGAVLDACGETNCAALIKKALASGHLPEAERTDFVARSMGLVMGHPATTSALVGTLSPEHLRENVGAVRAVTG